MALSYGPNLGLLVNGAEGEAHYDELMKQWRGLDLLVQARVIDMSLFTPPGSPTDGDAYIVAGGGSGLWNAQDNNIARWDDVSGAWEFFTPQEGWEFFNLDDSLKYSYDGAAWNPAGVVPVTTPIIIACSDEITPITAGTNKVTFHFPFDFELDEVYAGLTTPQSSGGVLTVDVNAAGSTLLSTKITIDNTEETSLTAATPPVISDNTIAKGQKITVDVDAIGDGTAAGLKVYLIGRKV